MVPKFNGFFSWFFGLEHPWDFLYKNQWWKPCNHSKNGPKETPAQLINANFYLKFIINFKWFKLITIFKIFYGFLIFSNLKSVKTTLFQKFHFNCFSNFFLFVSFSLLLKKKKRHSFRNSQQNNDLESEWFFECEN